MRSLFWNFLLIAFSHQFSAQVGGQAVYQFLSLPTSARQVALGGEVLTLVDDVNQPVWNPSVINPLLDRKLSLNYTNFLAGINIGSASYSHVINRRFGAIHGSINYLNYGTLIEADTNGNETGVFMASDLAWSIGYAYNFPNTNVYLGFNGKFIHSNIQNFVSYGIAADFAILYYNPYKPYAFSVVARNFGTQLKSFDQANEPLPFKVMAGGSYKLKYVPLKWHVTIDNLQQWIIAVPNPSNQTSDLEGIVTDEKISFFTNAIRHFVIGAELFSDAPISLRVGYNFKRSSELQLQNARSFSGISLGFGIKMAKLRFNYAFSKYHAATNASTFSLEFDLDTK